MIKQASSLFYCLVILVALILVLHFYYGVFVFDSQPARAAASTYTVDDTGDASDANAGDNTCATAGGVCTLRAAIEEANAHTNDPAGADTIAFDLDCGDNPTDPDTSCPGELSGDETWTITLGSNLPNLTEQIIIDGPVTNGGAGSILIDGDGSYGQIYAASDSIDNSTIRDLRINDTNNHCLNLSGNDNLYIYNVEVNNCINSGIQVSGSGITISNCTITKVEDTDGVAFGISFTADATNAVVSNNRVIHTYGLEGALSHGIKLVSGSGASISNNSIGSNVYGDGILLDSHTGATLDSNTIATVTSTPQANKHAHGIHIESSANSTTITNNTITASLQDCMEVDSSSNLIHSNDFSGCLNYGIGIAFDSNTIYSNSIHDLANEYGGIHLTSTAASNSIYKNTISNCAGDGIVIESTVVSANTIGGNETTDGNLIDGNDASDDGIYLQGDNQVIKNNTIRDNGGDGIEATSEATANTISSNTIGASGEANAVYGIRLNGADSNTLQSNTSQYNTWDGIKLVGNADSNTIISNNLSNNSASGIDFEGGASNTISDNTIASNGNMGISIGTTNCSGNVIDDSTGANEITGNTDDGIQVNSSSTTISGNTIGTDSSGNGGDGIEIATSGLTSLLISNNTIQNNTGSSINSVSPVTISENNLDGNDNSGGIFLNTGTSNSTISSNTIIDTATGQHGITIYGNNVEITNNTIGTADHGNGGAGISFADNCDNPTITGNKIEYNSDEGLFLGEGLDNASISNNTITNNGRCGIDLYSTNNNITISNNAINNNTQHGIIARTAGTGTGHSISNNTINSNGMSGINSLASAVSIDGNTISSNTSYGIYLTSDSNHTITDNTLASNSDTGIYIENAGESPAAVVEITGNSVTASAGSGLYMVGASGGTISNNTFSENTNGRGIEISASTTPSNLTIQNNQINSNDDSNDDSETDSGLEGNFASCLISGNTIKANGYNGINIPASGGNNVISDNLIGAEGEANKGTGLYIDSVDSDEISGNSVTYNTGHGINIVSGSNGNISSNTASHNTQYGISVGGTSHTLTSNTASNNTQYGINIAGNMHTLTSNIANSNTQIGIYVNGSLHSLTSNTANSNTQHGIALVGTSSCNLTSNTANSNTQYGIKLDSSDSNVLSSNTVSNNGSGAESETLSYYYEAFSYNGNVYDDDLWGACSGQGLNAYTSDFNEVWGMICADNSTIWNVSTVMDAGVTAEGFDFVFLDYSGSLLSIFFPKNLYGSKAAFEDPVTGTGIPVDVFVNNALIYDNDDDGVLDKSFYWDSDNAVIEPEGATFDNDVASFIAMTTVIEYTYADLYLSSSDSNSFSNGTLSALENGVKLDGDSTGNTITDSVISSSLGSDITSSSTGTNTFDNTTYSTYNVTAGTIDVNYDVRVNVTDNGSNNLQGATVTTTDTNSNDTDLGTTDSSGLTSYTSLDAYQIDSTGVINNKNDYTFSASHSSYDSTNTDQTVTLNSQNQNVTIALNQTLTLTAPNGGEEMDGDSVQSITWTSTGVIANVKLEYSTDGSNYTTIVASTTNDGSYSWTVPYISADTVTVRVSDASDSSFNDVSDASFIISSGGRYIPPNNGGGNSGGTTTPPADEEEDEDEEEETTEEESDTETGDESGSHHDQDSDDQSETEDDDSAEATIGDLVKVEDSSTVYQIGQDGQRHVFPDEKTYFSHYSDFSQVKTVPLTELQQYPLGDNITHKAGSLVKLMTVPKVYLVEGANTLRWIINESIFHALGYTFDLVNDLADSLFSNYQLGEDISG